MRKDYELIFFITNGLQTIADDERPDTRNLSVPEMDDDVYPKKVNGVES